MRQRPPCGAEAQRHRSPGNRGGAGSSCSASLGNELKPLQCGKNELRNARATRREIAPRRGVAARARGSRAPAPRRAARSRASRRGSCTEHRKSLRRSACCDRSGAPARPRRDAARGSAVIAARRLDVLSLGVRDEASVDFLRCGAHVARSRLCNQVDETGGRSAMGGLLSYGLAPGMNSGQHPIDGAPDVADHRIIDKGARRSSRSQSLARAFGP